MTKRFGSFPTGVFRCLVVINDVSRLLFHDDDEPQNANTNDPELVSQRKLDISIRLGETGLGLRGICHCINYPLTEATYLLIFPQTNCLQPIPHLPIVSPKLHSYHSSETR